MKIINLKVLRQEFTINIASKFFLYLVQIFFEHCSFGSNVSNVENFCTFFFKKSYFIIF